MGCFCHASAMALALQLPRLDAPAGPELPGADLALGLSAWLSARGLPAAPWRPDPAWRTVKLPAPRLSGAAVATISALAHLRAQALAQFGLDLLVPAQAAGFTRVVASMNARLGAQLGASASLDPLGLVRLATLNAATDQIQLALKAGVLAPSPSLQVALTLPGGVTMPAWEGLLGPLRQLAPLIAATLDLGVGITETAQFAAALKGLAKIRLPALAAPSLAAGLTAALTASASLRASLGADPLAIGLPAVRLQVEAKLTAVLARLSAQFGLDLSSDGVPALATLLALLPDLPPVPSALATPDVLRLAMQAQALAALDWQVPASLPAVQIGLTTCALTAQMQAALGIGAVLPAPCGGACDAAALLRAAVA